MTDPDVVGALRYKILSPVLFFSDESDILSQKKKRKKKKKELLIVKQYFPFHPHSISGNFSFQPCSHGDFLGAILGTGISRGKVGDVILQVQIQLCYIYLNSPSFYLFILFYNVGLVERSILASFLLTQQSCLIFLYLFFSNKQS